MRTASCNSSQIQSINLPIHSEGIHIKCPLGRDHRTYFGGKQEIIEEVSCVCRSQLRYVILLGYLFVFFQLINFFPFYHVSLEAWGRMGRPNGVVANKGRHERVHKLPMCRFMELREVFFYLLEPQIEIKLQVIRICLVMAKI